MEIWRKITGFDYEVSNLGRVRGSNRIRKLVPIKNGYITVILRKDGKSHCEYVHRLVAEAFIPNPDAFPVVNHLDRDKTNNRVDNLEWCTAKHNVTYSVGKQVDQFTLDGRFVKRWASTREAERSLGYPHGSVDKCAIGMYKQTHGFVFEYVMEGANEELL